MSSDPLFPTDSLRDSGIQGVCPKACPGSRPGGFCGLRIAPECLRIDAHGTVRVGLSATPEAWFEFLTALGTALTFTRNPVAVLGSLGASPRMDNWNDPVLPLAGGALMSPNLGEYARLWAFRVRTSAGPALGLEIEDVAGVPFQRVYLTGGAGRERFEEFVVQHQTPPGEAGIWFSPNQASSARRRSLLAARIPWLLQRRSHRGSPVRSLTRHHLAKLLEAIVRGRFPVRTMIYTSALIEGAVWIPGSEGQRGRSLGADRWLLRSERTVMQLDPIGIGSAWLWSGPCSCCGEVRWSIEIGDRSDGLALAVLAGHERLESEWRDLVSKVVQ